MVDRKPNVFVINIHPDNWDECLKGHRLGISVDTAIFVITWRNYGSGTVADLSSSMEWPSFRRR